MGSVRVVISVGVGGFCVRVVIRVDVSADEKISSNQCRCRWILCEGINQSRYKLMVFTLFQAQ